MSEEKISLLKQMLSTAEKSLDSAHQLLAEMETKEAGGEKEELAEQTKDLAFKTGEMLTRDTGRIIEGIFDGQDMVGPNSQKYPIPANYASKSKIVEGDLLKLTIASDGSFVYKQIGPVERKKVMGSLLKKASGEFRVKVNEHEFKVLLASVTYYQGQAGDDVTLIVPQGRRSSWGAIENIIKVPSKDAQVDQIEDDDPAQEPAADAAEPVADDQVESLDLPTKETPQGDE